MSHANSASSFGVQFVQHDGKSLARRAAEESFRPTYWLTAHVYTCPTPQGLIFLDLKRDKYSGLTMQQSLALVKVLHGGDSLIARLTQTSSLPAKDCAELEAFLLSQEIITSDHDRGHDTTIVDLSNGHLMSACGLDVKRRRPIQVADLFHFATACLLAALMLRFSRFDKVVDHVRTRKAASCNARVFDIERAAELTRIFRVLRSFTFTGRNNCLFHALALINFLSRYQLFPVWVVGVQTGPFRAHSWVQLDAMVFDGTPEQVCFYRPILAV